MIHPMRAEIASIVLCTQQYATLALSDINKIIFKTNIDHVEA